MSTITTRRPVNPGQLSVELGRKPTIVSGPGRDGTTKVTVPDIDEQILIAAVNAHRADSNWLDPDAPEGTPDPRTEFRSAVQSSVTVDDLKVALLAFVEGP